MKSRICCFIQKRIEWAMVPNIQASIDFVVARLHGIMANSIKGEALEKLARSTTEELLLRNLRNFGIDCKKREEFHRFIYDRELERLDKVARLLPRKEAAFYNAIQARSYFDNVKTALHWRYSRIEREAGELFLHTAGNIPHFDVNAMSEAADSRAFVRCIPKYKSFDDDALSAIVAELEANGDLMMADSKVDQAYFNQLWSAANDIKSSIGREACRLLGIEIDIFNLTALMRNALTYHFDAPVVSKVWLDHGELYDRHALDELSRKGDLPEIRASLRGKYSRVLASVGNDLHLVENALWKYLYKEVHYSFLAIGEPELCIAAYPFLVHFETLNLGRIYEGIYFGIPSHSILDIVLGVS